MTALPVSVVRAALAESHRRVLAAAGVDTGPYDADAAAAALAGPCMWPHQARVVCPAPADPEDPARLCADHAERDGRP